jgi:pimeloyl-ACP methyl ester carboxylesterase
MYKVGGLTPAADPGIGAAGYNLTFWLNAKDFGNEAFYGYIAQSKEAPGTVILAIRGTEDPAEWILDFAALPVFFHAGASAGSVALGFQSIEESFAFLDGTGVVSNLVDVVGRISAVNPITSLTILGHSLGAALATLAAAELAVRNTVGVKPAITIYTYASPRVGLLDFAAWFNTNIPTSYRIWNMLDIVPEVPTFPYIHVNGLGDRLTQTSQQMAMLQKTPQCEHNLGSYQWLLDPENYPLNNGCAVETPAVAHEMALTAAVAGVSAPAGGASVLHRAAFGR